VNSHPKKLGIIAGNRSLPLVLAREARTAGVNYLAAAAFEKETDPHLESLVDEMEWLRVGQLSKLINFFKKNEVTQCVMAGQIAPKNLFDLRPDLRAIKLLSSLKEKNAHSIFSAIAEELNSEGITLIEGTPWLKPAMPGPGFRLGPEITELQHADIDFGIGIAKGISKLEIGQSVVVKNGTTLAAEGFEGTDSCLIRGGELAGPGGGAIAVKVAKEDHDLRFDIPCLGGKTLKVCAEAGISVIAFEANRTLLLDGEEVEKLSKKNHISLIAF